ncbi:hypothetical protein [Kitasatospora sp. NPDC098663]|uniref:hypothetical protein n=1 Tax=Kitasatospora sp. NPDC098663 TaxID=3364096 RepID=UPI00381EFFDC
MTADLLLGSVLLDRDETDIIERALFIALYHRRPPADSEPSVDTCRALFDELRRVRSTAQPSGPESRRLAAAAADGVRHECLRAARCPGQTREPSCNGDPRSGHASCNLR